MKIIKYEPEYRDDLIFMVLESKNALGKVPTLNADLLDIEGTYFSKGDMFWICVDDDNRVIGSVGYSSVDNSDEVWLHRLFVKAQLKRKGIGTALLRTAEEDIIRRGKSAIHVHLGEPKELWYESRFFYLKHGYEYTENEDIPYLIKKIK